MVSIRFSVQAAPKNLTTWLEMARSVEDAGYDALLVGDHPGSGDPWVALASAAAVTTTLRLGTYVAQLGVRPPHHVADSAASLNALAPGRVILGLGAGHTPAEWRAIGSERPPVRERIDRFVEAYDVIERLLHGETVTFAGTQITLDDATLQDHAESLGHITMLIGGGNHRLLDLAGRRADIVGLAGLGRTLPDGHAHETRWSRAAVHDRVRLVAEAAKAAGRAPAIEALVQHVAVTDDRNAEYVKASSDFAGLSVEDATWAPYLLCGTTDQIIEQIHRQADELNITRYVIRAPAVRALAPVVAAVR